MKRSLLRIVLTAAALSAPMAFAVDEHHPDTDKGSAPATKAAPSKAVATKGMDMSQMQGNMKKMQEQMDKMQITADPKERQKLMGEHMQTMMAGMKGMHGMSGDSMMDGGKGGMADGNMMKRQEMMAQRMDMMQMMMEQMMQHQKAQEELTK